MATVYWFSKTPGAPAHIAIRFLEADRIEIDCGDPQLKDRIENHLAVRRMFVVAIGSELKDLDRYSEPKLGLPAEDPDYFSIAMAEIGNHIENLYLERTEEI